MEVELQRPRHDPEPAAQEWFKTLFKDNILGEVSGVPEGYDIDGPEHIRAMYSHVYFVENALMLKRALGDRKFYVRQYPKLSLFHNHPACLHFRVYLEKVPEERIGPTQTDLVNFSFKMAHFAGKKGDTL